MKAALGTSLLWFIGTGRATPTETTGIAPLDWAIGKITVTAYRPSHTHTVHMGSCTTYHHRVPPCTARCAANAPRSGPSPRPANPCAQRVGPASLDRPPANSPARQPVNHQLASARISS